MAYMNQEKKAKIAPRVKAILDKYGVKGRLSVRNHLALCLTITEGKVDFFNDLEKENCVPGIENHEYLDVNVYHYKNHFGGEAYHFLSEVIPALNNGNHDNSDIQSDYFDVGWYVDVNVGKWGKPYKLVK